MQMQENDLLILLSADDLYKASVGQCSDKNS